MPASDYEYRPTVALVDPAARMAHLLQIKGQIQQQQFAPQLQAQQLQEGALGIQEKQLQMAQTKAVNDAYMGALTVDANGKPSIDTDSLQKTLAANGHGVAIQGIMKGVNETQKAATDLAEAKGKLGV